MRLEWLEDIVAVIETGSFNAAAQRRFVTQPAFSRRIQAIEEYVGTELFDRHRKPVRLKPTVARHQEDIRHLVTQMKDLLYELRREGREAHNRIMIASQHSLTATRVPAIIELLSQRLDVRVRLRSANREECLALLMTKQVDLLINYQSAAEAAADAGDFLERACLGVEDLIPVYPSARLGPLEDSYRRGDLPVIAYPSDVFLGRIFNGEILLQIPRGEFMLRRVETALTLAALQFAIKGIGVAWVPESLARDAISRGLLCDLRGMLPSATLIIAALRRAGAHTSTENLLWDEILVACC